MNWSRRVSLSDELARASIFVFRAIVGQFAIPEPIVVIQPWIILLFPTAQQRYFREISRAARSPQIAKKNLRNSHLGQLFAAARACSAEERTYL